MKKTGQKSNCIEIKFMFNFKTTKKKSYAETSHRPMNNVRIEQTQRRQIVKRAIRQKNEQKEIYSTQTKL